MMLSICPHFGRRKGKSREEPIMSPSGKNCCYADLPEEKAPVATVSWLQKHGFLTEPSRMPCFPIGRKHQADYCLTANHVKCKLYHPPAPRVTDR